MRFFSQDQYKMNIAEYFWILYSQLNLKIRKVQSLFNASEIQQYQKHIYIYI